jgi:hypothetical protein
VPYGGCSRIVFSSAKSIVCLQQTSVTKAKMARSLSPPSGKGERHENSSLSFRCSDSRFFDAAGDGFLVIPSFYPKVVNVPGPGTIESYGVIGGAI